MTSVNETAAIEPHEPRAFVFTALAAERPARGRASEGRLLALALFVHALFLNGARSADRPW